MLIILMLLFLVQPFVTVLLSLYIIAHMRLCEREYKCFFAIVSLFLALLAFTQKTDVGDISRTYNYIYTFRNMGIKEYFMYSILFDKYVLFTCVNQIIYRVTGNFQYTSLFWVFIVYYLMFCSILNFYKYRKIDINNRYLLLIVIGSICCFSIYTQVTELMKQAVVASTIMYAFSNLLIGEKKKAIIFILLALGVHFTVFFLIPVLLAKYCNTKTIIGITLLSFLGRPINLMSLAYQALSKIGVFISLTNTAEQYQEELDGFFSSTSTFFSFSFFFFLLITFFVYFVIKPKDKTLVNASMLMIAVLNINFSVSHNFTRLLTMLYPFYIMLSIDILYAKRLGAQIRYWMMAVFLFVTFTLNFRMAYNRLSVNGTYPTSFMNNSIVDIVFSPSFEYLKFKF